MLGTVEELRFRSRHDRPDALVVRARGRRRLTISTGDVETIDVETRRILVRPETTATREGAPTRAGPARPGPVRLPRSRVSAQPISVVDLDFHRSAAFRVRVGALAVVAGAAVGVLGLRLWSLQVIQGHRYAHAAHRQALRRTLLPGIRGPIVDARGHVLVGGGARLVVTADPVALGHAGVRPGSWRPSTRGRLLLDRLARLAGIRSGTLVQRVRAGQRKDPFVPAVVLPHPSRPLAFFLDERSAAFPGMAVTDLPERYFPAGPLGGAFLGLIGEIDRGQLADRRYRGYRAGELIGRSGIEARYDRILAGTPPVATRVVDALGRPLGPSRNPPPKPPHGLQLTIDPRLQRAAERAIRDGIALAHAAGHADADAGAAVALDPRDGSVLALASYPGFDQARAASDPAYLERLLHDPSYPLLDRATQGLYPTGSAFKPIVAEAALSAGLISPSTVLQCVGALTVGNIVFHNVEPWINEPMTLEQALSVSCDTWFYQVGEMLYRRQTTQHSLVLQRWAARLGLGHPTGIDLPAESGGVVPTPAWLRRTFRDPWQRIWYEGTSVNLSIGQGYLAVTPLQLAVAYAALANGGTVVRPHLARAVLDAHGRPFRTLRFPPRAHLRLTGLDTIRAGLYSAAHDPGGTSAAVFGTFPVPVDGKTGTAQVPSGSDHSWYASWAPAGHPRIVVVTMIDHGGFGAEAAAPAAREIYSAFFHVPRRRGAG